MPVPGHKWFYVKELAAGCRGVVRGQEMGDRLTTQAQEMKGKAKEAIGEATDDEGLEARGKADQVKAASKRAGTEVKNAARKAKDTLSR
jgi:uncharacterized protein YjbJ (UPF0337 family)